MALPLPVHEPDEHHALRLVAEQAASAVGCAAAGVTVVRPHGPPLLTGTALLGAQLEEEQWDAGDGPGLDAMGQLQVFNVARLVDAQSWPGFVAHAVSRGVRSCLAVPIVLRGRALGALDLYSVDPDAFDGFEQMGLHFAGEAALTLARVEAGSPAPVGPQGLAPTARDRSRALS